MTKIGRFLRGFSLVDFSAVGFLGLLKTFKTQRQKVTFLYKSHFHLQSNAFLWFDFQTCGFTYQGGNASQQCSAALRQKAKKKFTTRGLFISAMSHVKLIAETRVYICHKNMKSMGFLQFFESFRGKIYKKYSIGNEEWIEFETATITSDYVLHNHLSIS